MYQHFLRPLLFRFEPETVHNFTVALLGIAGSTPLTRKLMFHFFNAHSHNITINLFNLPFPNKLGLAAGYDKDGIAWRGLATLGFGHIEIGTITPKPQYGNPKPRVFRIPEEQAIINRMGFPGKGAEFVAKNLAMSRGDFQTVVGVNIGKNKDTPIEEAAQDYLYLFEKFSPCADYISINVSSPNTVGLRRLQGRKYLEELLKQIHTKRSNLKESRPILVKLAPDLSNDELDDALEVLLSTGMDGVIAANTTIGRSTLHSKIGRESGGLSGAPLKGISRNLVANIYARVGDKLPIIGVGGIMTPDDAKAMLDSGASLIQIYTGLIYSGPGFVKQLLQEI
jgi:dihydroorotate dehydrogenase